MLRSLLAAGAVVLTAGCGGDNEVSPAEYEQQVNPIVAAYSADLFKLASAISRAPTPKLATGRIVLLETRLDSAADRLNAIIPPDDVADEHEQLTEGIRGVRDEVAELEDDAAVEQRDFTRLEDSFGAITGSDAAQDVARAAQAIEAAGYDIVAEG